MVWADAWGWANIEAKTAVTTGSRFPIASISKAMTAAIVVRLAERGVLDLDHDVREYVPAFPRKAFPVTSRQLLSHQAGIRHYRRIRTKPWLSELYLNRAFPDLSSALTLFADDPLAFEPDAGFLYSSFGYTLLGAAVEGATGKTFLDVLHEELLAPNHMSATGPDSSDAISGRTSDYVAAQAPGTVRAARATNSSYKWPGGGLLSTATDLVRFGQGMLANDIVPAEVRNVMFTPRLLRGGAENPMRYGLGWRVTAIRDAADSTRSQAAVYHGGSGVGAESALVLIPGAGVAVAIMGNASTGGDSVMVAVAIDIARGFVGTLAPGASGTERPFRPSVR
jgi:CubicO group peptidase (beta-lactamase class C family)